MSSERWFRRLLRLLPLDVRVDYGTEMERVFREQRREAAGEGRAGVVRFWSRTVAGLLAVGPREHLRQLQQDVRYALRSMRRNAGFVAVAILTLALGIGANTAIFSVVHAVLLRPLPYHDPDRLMAVWNRWDGSAAAALSDPEYLDYAEQSRTLTIAGASGRAVNVGGEGGDPERVSAAAVTSNALDVLGVSPALGRGFRTEDARAGAPAVTILADGFWRRRYNADPDIVGRSVSLNGAPALVIGVMRPGIVVPFEIGTISRAQLYVPLVLNPAAPRDRRGGHYMQAFARLNPGATNDSASAEMDGIIARLAARYPDEHDQGNFGIVVRSLRDDLLGASRPVLLVLSGAVALVLLLACTNVANLMLARGAARRRELAVRTALGATRSRIVRQLLTESCLLSIAGASAGLLVAYWSQQSIIALGAGALPRIDQIGLDRPVLIFSAALAAITGILFGLIPAVQSSRASANECLKDGIRGGTDGPKAALRRALVVCQVSAAVVLMIAAGLLVKSFTRLVAVPSGFDHDDVLTMRVTLPASRYPARPEVTAFFSRLLDRVRTLPGVRTAGAGSGLPLAVPSGDWSFDIEGRPRIGTRYPGAADWYVVTPGYFEALGIPLKRGRLPLAGDGADAAYVVFINEAAARAIFSNEDAVGRRIKLSQGTNTAQPWRTIVGIVGDVRTRGLDTPPRTEIFIPYEQFVHFAAGGQARAMTLVVKTERDPMSLGSAVRAELRGLDPEVPPAQVRDMADVLSESVSDRRLSLFLIGAFGGLALTLAAIGLYGVMAYNVAQRTREMGVRIAMGASRSSVLRLVVFEGIRMVLIGAAIGLLASIALSGSLAALLFEVRPHDATVLATAPVVAIVVGALASYFPARRVWIPWWRSARISDLRRGPGALERGGQAIERETERCFPFSCCGSGEAPAAPVNAHSASGRTQAEAFERHTTRNLVPRQLNFPACDRQNIT